MALTYSNFLKFDEVEAWYKSIEPVVKKKNSGRNETFALSVIVHVSGSVSLR